MLKSGGYRPLLVEEQIAGNTVTLSAGDDLLGYETAYYAVKSRKQGGVRLVFASAKVTNVDEACRESHPRPWRLQVPEEARFVRLLYLKRLSQTDHNMAVVAARDEMTLETLTLEVQADPGSACETDDRHFCSWVPIGIAVRPEMKDPTTDPASWVPAP
jgi:hypothetical protein